MAQDAFSFSLTSPDPASFFHFHFSPIEYLILSSSCLLHQEIAGLLGGGERYVCMIGNLCVCVDDVQVMCIYVCVRYVCV